MNGLPYYKAYPRDFIEGTVGMPFEVKCAYRVILDLIYMQGGKLPDDARYISGLLGCSLRKWKSIREELVKLGKVEVSGEFLTNYRARKELETLAKLQDNQREKASKPRKNNKLQQPQQSQPEPEPEPEPYIPVGTDKPVEDDLSKQIFDRGVAYLGRHGVAERQARSLIGKWRKDQDDAAIFAAFTACSKEQAVDPVSWITARLKPATPHNVVRMDDIFSRINADGSVQE